MPPEILTKIKNTTNKLRTLKLSKPHMLSKLPDISKLLPKKEEKQTFIVEQLRTEPKKYASSEDIDKTIEPSKQKQRKPRNK